jgi:hypothetical protein
MTLRSAARRPARTGWPCRGWRTARRCACALRARGVGHRALARGESVIRYKSPLNVLKDTYDHGCY